MEDEYIGKHAKIDIKEFAETEEKRHKEKLIEKCKDYHCEAQFKDWEGKDLSDAFWYALGSYQKKPSYELFKIMNLAYCWACHADHGLAHSFLDAWKWAGFDLCREYEKWKGAQE